MCVLYGLLLAITVWVQDALVQKCQPGVNRGLPYHTGDAIAAVSGALADLSERATSAPAGVLATVTGTVSVLPRLLLGDAIAAYQIVSDEWSRWGATGWSLAVTFLSVSTVVCGLVI